MKFNPRVKFELRQISSMTESELPDAMQNCRSEIFDLPAYLAKRNRGSVIQILIASKFADRACHY